MKPASFPQANLTLTPPQECGGHDIATIRVWSDGERVISLWRMTWRERLSALLFGKCYVTLLCGQRVPPVGVHVIKELF